VLVGDTGIDPVTSSAPGTTTELSTPPLSTKNSQLSTSSVAHLEAACAVDVISAIVVAQVAAMKAAGFGHHDRHRGRVR
jgi:hypothetical protein